MISTCAKILFLGLGIVLFASYSQARTLNARISPLGAIAGSLQLEVDFPITSQWTVGPYIASSNSKITIDDNDIEVKGQAFGATAVWFRNGVFTDGLYLSPKLSKAKVEAKLTNEDGTYKGDLDTMMLTGLVGYGWFWENFNMQLGGGLNAALGDSKIEITEPDGTVSEHESGGSLALEFSMGWVF